MPVPSLSFKNVGLRCSLIFLVDPRKAPAEP